MIQQDRQLWQPVSNFTTPEASKFISKQKPAGICKCNPENRRRGSGDPRRPATGYLNHVFRSRIIPLAVCEWRCQTSPSPASQYWALDIITQGNSSPDVVAHHQHKKCFRRNQFRLLLPGFLKENGKKKPWTRAEEKIRIRD